MTSVFTVDRLDDAARQIADLLQESEVAVAFTGAGISTESGVPDYRSPGGVWANNRTVYFDEYVSSEAGRQEYWRQKAVQCREFGDAGPNITHRVLAQLEQHGNLQAVITQNIDGLHEAAGSKTVLELHGTARHVACLSCDWQSPAEAWNTQFLETNHVPACPACGGIIKHATVSFGQTLPVDVLQAAADWMQRASVFLTLGSSLVVEPAASLPRLAARHGARLIIVNREPTPLDGMATLVVHAPLGGLFSRLQRLLFAG
jgi:NAD-dependent deacetylase